MKSDPHVHRCQSDQVDEATVLGARPSERWFECSYCRRFFSVVESLGAVSSITASKVSAEARRLILGASPLPTEAS